MSTADREATAATRDPADVARRLGEATFVRIVSRADGDGVAAAGVLARALSATGVPYQASVAPTVEARTERARRALDHADEGEATVVVGGAATSGAVRLDELGGEGSTPSSVAAWHVAEAIGSESADVLALAGAVAAGSVPGSDGTAPILEAARESGLGRRPGVAVPTTDLADGLAHSTLVVAPFSGDEPRARELLSSVGVDPAASGDDTDPQAHRRVASAVALSAVGDDAATPQAGHAIERALRPAVPGGPFATLGGYADVLDTVARERPGTAVALALDRDVREAALDCWRDHARRAHESLRAADTARYDGLLAASVGAGDVPVVTVARMLAAYRSPEPVVLVVADGRAGAVVRDGATSETGVGRAMRSVAEAVDGAADGTPRQAYATLGDADRTTAIAAFREAL